MFSSLKDTILAYNNQAVVDRIGRTCGLPGEESGALFRECVRFLALCISRPGETFVPSARVDDAWHDFVLHTRDYHQFCQEHHGDFIHHDPTESPDFGAYEKTRQALREEFGSLDERFWPRAQPGKCSGSCDSGSCKGVAGCSGSCDSGSCKGVAGCSGSCDSGSCKGVAGCTGSCSSGSCKTLV